MSIDDLFRTFEDILPNYDRDRRAYIRANNHHTPRCASCEGLLLVDAGGHAKLDEKDVYCSPGGGYEAGDLICFWCYEMGMLEPGETSRFLYGHC